MLESRHWVRLRIAVDRFSDQRPRLRDLKSAQVFPMIATEQRCPGWFHARSRSFLHRVVRGGGHIMRLEAAEPVSGTSEQRDGPVHHLSSPESKIALFRSLFRGRDDVYPRRFENPRTGKSGYSPACGNEWAPGLCAKPRIK